MTFSELVEHAPPPASTGANHGLRAALAAGAPILVVVDDDPTGTQTVHGVPLVTEWSVPVLREALATSPQTLFVLTNSRSLPAGEAHRAVKQVVENLRIAAAGRPFTLCSRSDSTLRGHFVAELDGIFAGLGATPDLVLLVPAFFEGGRYTVDDVHYLRSGEQVVPVAESTFARDETFGYHRSNLREWVEEKTEGRIPAQGVASIPLAMIRTGGIDAVAGLLARLARGTVVVVNALDRTDLDVVALAALQAEQQGRTLVYRTAASFVAARAGISPRPLLAAAELNAGRGRPGVVVVGSHVERTSRQLKQLLELPVVTGIEIDVSDLLGDQRGACLDRAAQAATAALTGGLTPVLSTSRAYRPGGAQALKQGRRISDGLVEVFHRLPADVAFVVAKGGITSHEIATRGLGIVQAMVKGQIHPGVPVWSSVYMGDVPYVVFPGNVGEDDALARVVATLHGASFS